MEEGLLLNLDRVPSQMRSFLRTSTLIAWSLFSRRLNERATNGPKTSHDQSLDFTRT